MVACRWLFGHTIAYRQICKKSFDHISYKTPGIFLPNLLLKILRKRVLPNRYNILFMHYTSPLSAKKGRGSVRAAFSLSWLDNFF